MCVGEQPGRWEGGRAVSVFSDNTNEAPPERASCVRVIKTKTGTK